MINSPCSSPLIKMKRLSDEQSDLSFVTLKPLLNGYIKTVKSISMMKPDEGDISSGEDDYELSIGHLPENFNNYVKNFKLKLNKSSE